eukprot:8325143-Pyramimonas_sp.AAC.2
MGTRISIGGSIDRQSVKSTCQIAISVPLGKASIIAMWVYVGFTPALSYRYRNLLATSLEPYLRNHATLNPALSQIERTMRKTRATNQASAHISAYI